MSPRRTPPRSLLWASPIASSLSATGPLMMLRSRRDRKSTRLNSSHLGISYAVFCLEKREEEDREGHSRILDVEAGDDLALALGHVEGRAVGLGEPGDEVNRDNLQERDAEPLQEALV